MSEHDLLVQSRFKNLKLWQLCEGTKRTEMAALLGITVNALFTLLSLKCSPFRRNKSKHGEYKEIAHRVANFFDLPVEELFPPSLYRLKIPALVSRTFSSEKVVSMLDARKEGLLLEEHVSSASVEKEVIAREMKEALAKALTTMKPRYRKVISMRFGMDGEGERTLEEIGQSLGLGKARIRQMETRALRDLRHPSKSGALRDFVDMV